MKGDKNMKTTMINARVPVDLKRKFVKACKKLRTTQHYIMVDAMNNVIKKSHKGKA